MLRETTFIQDSRHPSLVHRSTNAPDFRRPSTSFVPRSRALFWEGEEEAQKIQIVEGVVRAVRLLENGNRQILAFYWPGDVVMPTHSTHQQFTAEAVTDCRVIRSKTSRVCRSDEPCGAHQVLADTLTLVMTMSQKNCVARIAWLLLRIRPHLPADPKRPGAFRLQLPRADIADHVGTSLETVCRTLAEFKAKKVIDLPNRKTIKFIDLEGLARISNRRAAD
ncbi:Crp/Fnr family transcriptional regulator [Bradyrhizobium yuanmingense]|uniref:Crp/Fnr family transcriptional regulator n=1 Tax=Bradyrhizobium yuanmingense TaxID=108015 RepID=UPI0023B95D1C|nr:helix-turn-helix domain-containing protein [Bradyrhizobium yuanmingense]MDF0520526.1 helix-turn-helix domain-containing protein [Bradyrhizobium yuanmingense]MDF0578234.1 helix-turn-helix domain-containing protein [Bradyrhizobium yuanmingense]